MGEESPLKKKQINDLAISIEEHIDIDRLLQLSMINITGKLKKRPKRHFDQRARLAIAQDQAFCFYYQDNFELFQLAGIDCVFFSPLHDTVLPENIDGIYIGGGYPELHADQLSGNRKMRQQIKTWVDQGGPVYCECGGFMYMAKELIDLSDNRHPMVGVFPIVIAMSTRLSRLGYREITLSDNCMFGKSGDNLYGHEFHYSTIKDIESRVATVFTLQDGTKEGYVVKNVLGGYLHMHFGHTEKAVDVFYNFLCKGKGKKSDGYSKASQTSANRK
jgi:cobyrinic acid a,c-diamide synthase